MIESFIVEGIEIRLRDVLGIPGFGQRVKLSDHNPALGILLCLLARAGHG